MTSEPSNSTPLRRLSWVAGILACLVVVVWWPGCRQYPPVSSRENLDLIKLVYAACNTRNSARLANAERRLEIATRQHAITPDEESAFRKILGLARAGDWKTAESAAFQFAKDQVGQGKVIARGQD